MWVEVDVNNDGASTPGVTVAKGTPVAGKDIITLTLQQGLDAQKFARLKAV